MAALEHLGAEDLRSMVTAYADVLREHAPRLDRLNVYPVRDADTGTNMARTVEAVALEVARAAADMAATCAAIATGALLGARGNSGVILSQVLRGIATTLSPSATAGAREVADALTAAATAAYGAVMQPVEGTLLTVAREAGAAASKAAGAGAALVEVLEAARAAGQDALDNTPELLPVLKEAGVVDAGGAGFLLLLDAALAVVAGRPLPQPGALADAPAAEASPHEPTTEGPRFEVMFLLEAPDEAVEGLRRAWAGLGESIAVAGGDGQWTCHVHTDEIGAAIEAGYDVGRPRGVRVADLRP